MQYKLIFWEHLHEFEDAVTEHIQKGWELHGPTFVKGACWCQALIWPRGQG